MLIECTRKCTFTPTPLTKAQAKSGKAPKGYITPKFFEPGQRAQWKGKKPPKHFKEVVEVVAKTEASDDDSDSDDDLLT